MWRDLKKNLVFLYFSPKYQSARHLWLRNRCIRTLAYISSQFDRFVTYWLMSFTNYCVFWFDNFVWYVWNSTISFCKIICFWRQTECFCFIFLIIITFIDFSKILLDDSHLSDNEIYCSIINIDDVNSYWAAFRWLFVRFFKSKFIKKNGKKIV